MARLFPGSTNTDRVVFSSVTAASTRTYATWIILAAYDSTARRIIEQTSCGLFYTVISGADALFFVSPRSTTTGLWGMTGLATGAWAHVAMTYDGGSVSNDPIFYLNGVAGTTIELTAPVGTETTGTADLNVGNGVPGTWSRCFNGRIAEIATWGSILTAAQILMMAKGISPLRVGVKPIFYSPFWGRFSSERSLITGDEGVVTGTSFADHAPVFYSNSLIIGKTTGAAPAAGQPIIKRYQTIPFLAGSRRQGAF